MCFSLYGIVRLFVSNRKYKGAKHDGWKLPKRTFEAKQSMLVNETVSVTTEYRRVRGLELATRMYQDEL